MGIYQAPSHDSDKTWNWQIGKSDASIVFVNDAEAAIRKLQKRIDQIKNGEINLGYYLAVDDFLVMDL